MSYSQNPNLPRVRMQAVRLHQQGWSARKIGRYLGYHHTDVAMYPYLPEAESAAEQLEVAFEKHAKEKQLNIDLDLALLDTYGDGIGNVGEFDIAEIDLCMLDKLRSNGELQLDVIPEGVTRGSSWVGPAAPAMQRPLSKYVVPHWVCGNFLVHWSVDGDLAEAKTFNEIRKALEPREGPLLIRRYLGWWNAGRVLRRCRS